MPIGEILDMLLHTNHYLFQVLESSVNDKVLQLYIHCILLCCYLNKELCEKWNDTLYLISGGSSNILSIYSTPLYTS